MSYRVSRRYQTSGSLELITSSREEESLRHTFLMTFSWLKLQGIVIT